MNSLTRKEAMPMLNKVPEITLYFWIIKIMATTVGETAADFLSINLHLGLTGTSVIMSALLSTFLFFQLRAGKYIPWLYWVTVVLISIVGTLITDNMVDNFGMALETTSIIFGLALMTTFFAWYVSEKTLSIHTIFTRKRELFYWSAILFTFALGTAGGDLMAEGFGLGYAASALIFAALIAAITVSYYHLKINAIPAFWMAYILTRPLGASCGDYLSQPIMNGGSGLGTVDTSMIFFATIAILVCYLSITKKDAQNAMSVSVHISND